MQVTIRAAVDSDVPEILRLYQEAGIGDGVSFTVEEARAQMKKFERYPNYRVL